MTELLFTSDGKADLVKAVKLLPSPDVLLTTNFMENENAMENLAIAQVGVVNAHMPIIPIYIYIYIY